MKQLLIYLVALSAFIGLVYFPFMYATRRSMEKGLKKAESIPVEVDDWFTVNTPKK